MKKEKENMREKLRGEKAKQTHADFSKVSADVHERLFALGEFKKAKRVCTYVSTKHEVDTEKVIEKMLKEGKEVFVPKLTEEDMVAVKIHSLKDLWQGKFGILEPREAKEISEGFDLIIVPGLGFDEEKARLGRGAGHFDRFLARAKGKKIALAFEWQIVGKVPANGQDARMDLIVTEKRVIE